jgi:flagellar biogenesis protein FliO
VSVAWLLVFCAAPAAGQAAEAGPSPHDGQASAADTDAAKAENDRIDWGDVDEQGGQPLPNAEGPNLWSVMANLIVAMVVIVGIVVAGMVVMQKLGGRKVGFGGKDKPLRVVDRQMLGPKKAVVLLNACGRYLVLGVADKEIAVITEVDFPADAAEHAAAPADFAEAFGEAGRKDVPGA